MRRFALAAAAVLALSPLVGLAWASSPASAAVTHTAVAAASTCHDESILNDVFTSGGTEYGGNMQAYGLMEGDQVQANRGATARVDWCEVAGNVSGYILLRLQGTSYCAEYSGPSGGPGEVELEPCDSSRTAQNWYGSGQPTVIYNEDEGAVSCLSSDKGANPQQLVIVTPAGGCTGAGGQDWYGYP